MQQNYVCQRISPEQAAIILGCDGTTVREKMRKFHLGEPGGWDLGEAIPPGPGCKNWTFYPYIAKIRMHVGLPAEEGKAIYIRLRAKRKRTA